VLCLQVQSEEQAAYLRDVCLVTLSLQFKQRRTLNFKEELLATDELVLELIELGSAEAKLQRLREVCKQLVRGNGVYVDMVLRGIDRVKA
jgi:hypothetical protein